jgi:ComF family protein
VERDPLLDKISLARRAVEPALDFALPRTCVCCERSLDAGETGLACGRCWTRLALLPHPQCGRCGHPLRGRCSWCETLPEYVAAVRSVCWMHAGTGGALVHALKYRGWHGVAREMAERMSRLAWPTALPARATALIPVPLARSRERERGYNQSERLARALADRLGVALWAGALERVKTTGTQTRLTAEDRLANVSNAFRVRDASRPAVRNAHVVLVDDVVTTGATLNACAAALREGGARSISYVTFGRAPARGDR